MMKIKRQVSATATEYPFKASGKALGKRGAPKKEHPLTPAERAKQYRARNRLVRDVELGDSPDVLGSDVVKVMRTHHKKVLELQAQNAKLNETIGAQGEEIIELRAENLRLRQRLSVHESDCE
jgi:hypothetical protein